MRKALLRTAQFLGLAILLVVLLSGLTYWYLNPWVEHTEGIVYGTRADQELTFDIVRPRNPNGKGVLLMMSGAWKSGPQGFRKGLVAPLLRSGYTIFPVSHISQPKARVQDTVEDIHRAVRFIRYHAEDYGVDPDHLGISGASSGGHLSLMIATRGGPGPADDPDPVNRESSAVQAVAVFFPVTNLINLGTSTENLGDGGPPKSFRNSFGPEAKDLENWKVIGREISPVYHVTEDLPPTLIIHGDADTLVPLEQSEWFVEAAESVGANVELRVRPGKGHGWLTMVGDIRQFASWFDEYLHWTSEIKLARNRQTNEVIHVRKTWIPFPGARS